MDHGLRGGFAAIGAIRLSSSSTKQLDGLGVLAGPAADLGLLILVRLMRTGSLGPTLHPAFRQCTGR